MPITRKEFISKCFKAYSILTHDKYDGIEFMVIAVDYDAEIFTLRMIENQTHKVNNRWNELDTHISHVSFPKEKPKPMKPIK